MTRPPRLLAAVLALLLAALPSLADASTSGKMVVPLDHYFIYDGRSSDLAQHYYRRYLENDYVAPLTIAGDMPEKVLKMLEPHGLKFKDLPGLLQRAVMWDAGYVLDLTNVPIRQYTRCGRTMAQISVPLKGYVRGGCIPRNCSTLNGDLFYRSFFCDGHQMGAASLCASQTTSVFGHSAMWADGAEPDEIPEPRVYRHPWTSDGESFLIYGIHMRGLEEEAVWEKCPVTPAPIFPCVPYSMVADRSQWCDPPPGKIVTPWLHNFALEHKKRQDYFWVVIGIAIAVVVIVLSRFFVAVHQKRRQGRGEKVNQEEEEDEEQERRSSTTSFTNDGNASDYAHEPHDYLDNVADNEYTSYLFKSGVPESFHDETEMLDGRDEAAIKTLQMFEVHPLINYKRIAFNNISLQRILARGATGEVWLGTLLASGREVAIKRLLPEKRRVLAEMQLFASEIFAMAKLKHPNVISFIGVAWSTLQNMLLVMQHMDKGDLQSYLQSQLPHQKLMQAHEQAMPGFTWWDQKLQTARSVASALQYLHSLSPKLIHRDIKSKNVLLASNGRMLDVKLADFGVSRRKYNFEEEETNLTMTGAVGTVSWTAPELLLGEDYTESIDMYSYGILLTEIDTCELPYHDPKSARLGLVVHPLRLMKLVVHEGRRPELSASVPDEIAELIRDCLEKDPEKRPTAAMVVERLDLFEATHHC